MAVDLSGPKNPPPSRVGRPRRAETVPVPQTKRQEREEGLGGVFQLVAAGLLMGGQPADAAAVAEHGPSISHEAAALADQNEKIGKVLDYLTAAGPFAALLGAVMPLALQVLVNHGKIPMAPVLTSLGVKDPQTLEAKARADAMRQLAAAQAEQEAAEAELMAAMAQAQAKANAQANGRPTPTDIRVH